MPRYLVYGLNLSTNQEIPGLVAYPQTNSLDAEVDIHLGFLPQWLEHDSLSQNLQQQWYVSSYKDDRGVPGLQIWQLNQGAHFWLRYSDGTQFVVDSQGTQIWASWPDSLTLEDTATYLLGPILGWVLRLKGVVCLHASAVVVEKRVIAFVGDAGAGKSTTAAAFAQAGYPILSDDVVALVEQQQSFWVQPAYPRIRLWKESVGALYGNPEALPKLVPTNQTWDKRYLNLDQDGYVFQSHCLPLGCIYLFQERSADIHAPYIEAVSHHSSLINLVGNTYGNYLLDKAMRRQEFELLGRLVESVIVRQLIPHTDYGRIPQLIETVLQDFSG